MNDMTLGAVSAQVRPGFAVYDQDVTIDGKAYRAGLWYHGQERKGAARTVEPVDQWVSIPLHIEAETLDENGYTGRLLRFTNRGRPVRWVLPMGMLATHGGNVLKALFRQGFTADHQGHRQVLTYLREHPRPERLIQIATKPGWHDSGVFVLPGKPIGAADVYLDASRQQASLYHRRGTLDGWRQSVGLGCLGDPALELAVCLALAGPLLDALGVPGGGVHLLGGTDSSAPLAVRVAASVWGDPFDLTASWHSTQAALIQEAIQRNNTVLPLNGGDWPDLNAEKLGDAIARGRLTFTAMAVARRWPGAC